MTLLTNRARTLAAAACALACSGCFQFSTTLTVKGDGSGLIDQRIMFTQAAIAQLKQFAALSGGGGGGDFDPMSEQQAKDLAATMGRGVTYVSSTPINTTEYTGRAIKYAFTDINELRLDQTPPPPGGGPAPQSSEAKDRFGFKLTRQPDGHSLLKIAVPPADWTALGGSSPLSNVASPDQIAMLRPMFAGARLSLVVEPVGRLIRTTSPFVAGQRVTLADINLDALLSDATLISRLQAAASPDEMKTILKGTPGLQINLDPEISIEFEN